MYYAVIFTLVRGISIAVLNIYLNENLHESENKYMQYSIFGISILK